jgi:hypothetical protein
MGPGRNFEVPVDRYLKQVDGYLLVEVGRGTMTEVAGIYRSLAYLCVKKQLTRVLVKVADDDEADGEHALRDALTTMLLAGLAPGFRIALLAATQRVGARYRTIQSDLVRADVDARIFESEEAAARWLNGSSGGAAAASP